MKIDFKVIIILALILALILAITFWPKPQPSTDEKALADSTQVYKAREREAVKLQIDIARKLAKDSVDAVKSKEFYQKKIGLLTRKLNSINTSKSTDKELDSLITELYGQ